MSTLVKRLCDILVVAYNYPGQRIRDDSHRNTLGVTGTWKQDSGRKVFGIFPVISDWLLAESAGKWSKCARKNPEIFRPEYGFHVPVTSGVFLQDPAFLPSISCRFLRNPVTGIFDLGNVQ